MKMRTVALVFCIAIVAEAAERDSIVNLLRSTDWDHIAAAVDMVDKNIDTYRADSVIRRELRSLLRRQTERAHNPASGYMPKLGDSGEIVLDVLALALKFDIHGTIPDLMDWATNASPAVPFLATRIRGNGCKGNVLLDTLARKFRSSEEYFRERRGGYLKVATAAVGADTEHCQITLSLAEEMLLDLLRSTNRYDRLDALDECPRFVALPSVRHLVDSLAGFDTFTQKRKGVLVYPVREAARAALSRTK